MNIKIFFCLIKSIGVSIFFEISLEFVFVLLMADIVLKFDTFFCGAVGILALLYEVFLFFIFFYEVNIIY